MHARLSGWRRLHAGSGGSRCESRAESMQLPRAATALINSYQLKDTEEVP